MNVSNLQGYCRVLLTALVWISMYVTGYAQWIPATSGTNQTLTDVGYGGGQWVAVGVGGTILTSPDGISWTPRTSGVTTDLIDIDYDGIGRWVAVGDKGTIVTSTDGISWTTAVSGTNSYLDGISYGNGKWVAVGLYYTNLLSSDGLTWEVVPWDDTFFAHQYGVGYGGGQWISVGTPLRTSPDGITWTNRTSTIPKQPRICQCVYNTYLDVNYGAGRWVAVSLEGSVITSTDGVTWEEVEQYWYYLRSVKYGGGNWVAVGSNAIAASSDGRTWRGNTSSYDLNGVVYGNNQWVAVGGNGAIIYSSANSLPVSLLSFQGSAEGHTAHLTWETAWEKSASHFLIERSLDAKSFEAIGRLEAQGTTDQPKTYSFFDKDLASTLWYYRLRQVDLDGSFTHSSIIAVRIGDKPLETLTLYPNPGSASGPVTLEAKDGISAVRIRSVTGTLVDQQSFKQPVKQWSWESGQQASGMYLVEVQDQAGKVRTLRWVKP